MTRALVLILLLSGCSLKPPRPTKCTIINPFTAECVPTDPAEPIYDEPVNRMRGYMCFSPDDIADIRVYIKAILDEVE